MGGGNNPGETSLYKYLCRSGAPGLGLLLLGLQKPGMGGYLVGDKGGYLLVSGDEDLLGDLCKLYLSRDGYLSRTDGGYLGGDPNEYLEEGGGDTGRYL